MGGLNEVARLKAGGINAKKGNKPLAPVDDIWIPPAGHPLWHPRQDDPIDEALVDSIMGEWDDRSFITVRDDGLVNGRRRLTLVDGCRRTIHGREAQRRLRKAKKLVKDEKNPGADLYVQICWFRGDDDALLFERLRLNREDPLRKADVPSVLAATAKQLAALRVEPSAIAEAMPKGVGRREVEALLDWSNLLPEVARRFDEGAPLIFLRSVLDAARDQQATTLERLMASGAKSAAGATKVLRRQEAGRTEPALRIRPRRFLTAFRDKLREDPAACEKVERMAPDRLLDFLLGDDAALAGFDDVAEVAKAAGWKGRGA